MDTILKSGDFRFHDEWGPEHIIKISDPKIGLKGILVIDNTTLGPGKGGIRMTSNITEEEVFRLARTMTWKNALAGIPFGGAKAGIIWNKDNGVDKKELIQGFARAIKIFTPKKYIAGPDVNTGEREMQWFVEATGNWRTATGKPANYCMAVFGKKGEKCGIPHEFGSTGFGVAQATAVAAKAAGIDIVGATFAIHGFGNVGTFAYRYLTEMGAKVVALADIKSIIYNPDGFDNDEIEKLIKERQLLDTYKNAKLISPNEFWGLAVDILIPASVTDVINQSNKNLIKAKVIVEAGNIPMQESIEAELFKKGIMILPDFVANAGGVISSYAEYRGYNPKQMFELVKRKIVKASEIVLKESLKSKTNPRRVALDLAQEKIKKHRLSKS